ncbi:AAA family ATPase [Bacteroides fragilis]
MIERVIIENFKGIKKADISFNDKINIIVGNNGIGKSTLIEAMALALGYGINQLEITQYLFTHLHGKSLMTVRFYLKLLLNCTSIKHCQLNTLEKQ